MLIIKDKDLPPTCAKCPFSQRSSVWKDDRLIEFNSCFLEDNLPIPIEGYHERRTVWCPLMRG